MAVDLRHRGLRNPRHNFAVNTPGRQLLPTFIAPLRPMETMIGLRYQAHSYTDTLLRVGMTVPIEVEYTVWKVSVRQLGAFFTDLFTRDMEDQENNAASYDISSGQYLPTGVVNTQGQQTQGALQTRDRNWAGEVGNVGADLSPTASRAYAPYVSHAIWHIARMCYDMELASSADVVPLSGGLAGAQTGNLLPSDPNLMQKAPVLGRLVRGASASMMGAGSGADSSLGTLSNSLSEWAERLSTVDNPNRTYFDYLKAFGVHPSRIPGMPEPVMMQRRTLHPYGVPFNIAIPQTFAAAPGQPSSYNVRDHVVRYPMSTEATTTNGYALVDQNDYQVFSAAVDATRGKRLIVDEPSFLVGTIAWWPHDFDVKSGAHVMDAVYLINSGTWGDPSKGSPDERDFLIVRDIKKASNPLGYVQEDDVAYAAHSNDDAATSPFAMNMLNLYLNGDSYTNSTILFGHHQYVPDLLRPAAQDSATVVGTNDAGVSLRTLGSVRIGVATDLTA